MKTISVDVSRQHPLRCIQNHHRYCRYASTSFHSRPNGIAKTRTAAAALIDPSYLPGGANVHPRLIHGSMSLTPIGHLDRFTLFAGLTAVTSA